MCTIIFFLFNTEFGGGRIFYFSVSGQNLIPLKFYSAMLSGKYFEFFFLFLIEEHSKSQIVGIWAAYIFN